MSQRQLTGLKKWLIVNTSPDFPARDGIGSMNGTYVKMVHHQMKLIMPPAKRATITLSGMFTFYNTINTQTRLKLAVIVRET